MLLLVVVVVLTLAAMVCAWREMRAGRGTASSGSGLGIGWSRSASTSPQQAGGDDDHAGQPPDERRSRFRVWSEHRPWAAVHDLAPNHMLYVIARNADPAEVELTREVDIREYIASSAQ